MRISSRHSLQQEDPLEQQPLSETILFHGRTAKQVWQNRIRLPLEFPRNPPLLYPFLNKA